MMSRRDQVLSIISNKGYCGRLHAEGVCPRFCVITRELCSSFLINVRNKDEILTQQYKEAISIGIREGLLTEEEIFDLKI